MYSYGYLIFSGRISFFNDCILVCVNLYCEAFLSAFNGVTSCRGEDDDEDEDKDKDVTDLC